VEEVVEVEVVLVVTDEKLEVVVEYVVVEELPWVEEKLPELLSSREESVLALPEEFASPEEITSPEELVSPEETFPVEEAAPTKEAVPPKELVSPELVPPEEPVSPGMETDTPGRVSPVEAGITLFSPKPPEAEP